MENQDKVAHISGKYAVVSAIIGLVGAFGVAVFTQLTSDSDQDNELTCVSDHTPSKDKHVEATAFVRATFAHLQTEWDKEEGLRRYRQSTKTEQQAKAETDVTYKALEDRPAALVKLIAGSSEIELSDLQAVNKAMHSDCMKQYRYILKIIHEEELRAATK